MIRWQSTPGTEWYDVFDCSDCHRRTLLSGVVIHRSLSLLLVRIPLGRRWLFRCQSCDSTQKVDQKTWRERRQQGITPQEAYLERQRIRVLAQRGKAS
jgi:hypothetical protein